MTRYLLYHTTIFLGYWYLKSCRICIINRTAACTEVLSPPVRASKLAVQGAGKLCVLEVAMLRPTENYRGLPFGGAIIDVQKPSSCWTGEQQGRLVLLVWCFRALLTPAGRSFEGCLRTFPQLRSAINPQALDWLSIGVSELSCSA